MVDPSSMLGPLDAVSIELLEYLLLGLVLVNFGTRFLAHRSHVSQYEEGGADAISRNLVHEVSNGLLVVMSFYFMTRQLHGGVVFSTLVLGLVITDFFEFEARQVEARKDEPLDRPKGALVASLLVFSYIAYESVFFIIKPIWSAII